MVTHRIQRRTRLPCAAKTARAYTTAVTKHAGSSESTKARYIEVCSWFNSSPASYSSLLNLNGQNPGVLTPFAPVQLLSAMCGADRVQHSSWSYIQQPVDDHCFWHLPGLFFS
eukprot:219328-Amphidinium_carterae.1